MMWNPSKPDTIEELIFVLYREVSLTQGLFCMCVYVNRTTDSVLYNRGDLISGVSFKRGSSVLIAMDRNINILSTTSKFEAGINTPYKHYIQR